MPRQSYKPAASGVVRLSQLDDVALITIDNPPVNAGSHAVRTELLACMSEASALDLRGVVILGAGQTFIAGSDIREFGAPLKAPELPDVIAAIEACPHPVCAAIHGAALGGGFELALGCDLRIGVPDTVVGLPEVTLGMVPGAGGTQRLPRLVGVATAIGLVTSGKRIKASEAQALGILDAVAASAQTDDLLECAVAALTNKPGKRCLRDLPMPPSDADRVHTAAADALRRGRGRPNVAEAIRLVKAAETATPTEGLTEERRVFQKLRLAPEAFALRHLFFAERSAARIDGLNANPADIARIGIVGGGTMGQGIARACIASGLRVTLAERDADSARAASDAISTSLKQATTKGRIDAAEATARRARLAATQNLEDLADCDLVIEAVFEDMAVKQTLFATLDRILQPGTILASNTSYLDLNVLAASTSRAQDVIGLHFFSPADVMRLLEIVQTDSCSDRTLATALAFAKALGKQAVVAQVCEGFIGNRIYAAYRRQAEFLVEDGATPQEVDSAATRFGFALGPLAVGDLSGLDIGWHARQRQAPTRDARARYVDIPDRLYEAGRLGRKTGAGWYDYPEKRPESSAEVAEIIDRAQKDKGITPRAVSEAEIIERLLGAILNEAAHVLSEGIARAAGDIDVTLVHGYGFPRWTGGPLWWAAGLAPDRVAQMIAAAGAAQGFGFAAGPIDAALGPLRAEHQTIEDRKAGA